MNFLQWLQVAGSVITLIGVMFIIYKNFTDPDIKAANRIDLLSQGCELKHDSLDKLWGERFSNIESSISTMKNSLMLLQENDLKHIENSISALEKGQERILTIMDERFPKK